MKVPRGCEHWKDCWSPLHCLGSTLRAPQLSVTISVFPCCGSSCSSESKMLSAYAQSRRCLFPENISSVVGLVALTANRERVRARVSALFILDLLGDGLGCPGWSERGWETSPSEGRRAGWPASRSLKGEREREEPLK